MACRGVSFGDGGKAADDRRDGGSLILVKRTLQRRWPLAVLEHRERSAG